MQTIDKRRIPSPHSKIHLYEITYISGPYKVKGLLAEPKEEKEYPGLLYLRGGIHNVGMVRIQRIIQWANEGFIVMAPYYRGNRGGEGMEDFAGHDREDAIAAYDLLATHPHVCEEQRHIIGFSRGGVMALLTMLARDTVASATLWSGVSDMTLTYEERVDLRRMMKRVIGGTPKKYPERFEWRGPLKKYSSIKTPLLLIHGEKDHHVTIEHALRLQKEAPNTEAWFFSNYRHHFPAEAQRMILKDAAQWMKNKNVNLV
ncbi:alpha/beta hydrolase family protein [Alkalihalobacillus trypoxylicola]|uniref:Peptidase n=1 Tax=Alkalihalobacillus trypoxylicola TaxID=519424 RepID=A0A161QDU6_9BACI|nr:prolyl oligopeptidase family serine peptidase [Alkalihalobacillus trypoxylicola]KYG26637.1 peptidase [Alkalihalobacillus trypoxylicola]